MLRKAVGTWRVYRLFCCEEYYAQQKLVGESLSFDTIVDIDCR